MPQHFVSLKRTKAEAKAREAEFEGSFPEDTFPVSLHLGTEEVEKLALEGAETDDEMVLIAKVRVSSVSSHDSLAGRKTRSVTLEFLEAAFEPEEKETVEQRAARKLFGSKE